MLARYGEVVGDRAVCDDPRERLTALRLRPTPSEATTTAAAPSFTPGALPAVWVASSPPTAFSLASVSIVVSGRIASSASTTLSDLRLFTVTEVISSARRPSSVAFAASWCERAAQRSMSARVISSSFETSLASLIICLSVKGLVSPSWVIASIAFTSPIRKPKRAPGSR